ncbi:MULTISPECIES: MFS transporter [unclassified Prevotella]|jgi:PAT family beta-lactamase induction signal transducer AmpG|uniref:MFS transporter n=1 Tax=unclassified Prevotella TaxID=2638335 RepID=UPI000564217C|nr:MULTISPECIES: MFS transporter [unclassified Prevotella]MCR5471389.1 MFS transporter [Prevotella sp.]SEW14216.1 MFS transporter, PAT family, beta-lactamase induction signal transducer AmpG [Prevotella sp. khp7]
MSKQKSPWAWVPTLYFAEGVPYVAVMTISVIIYKRLGLSNTDITLYTSWLYLPWVIKPLWSPFVDMLRTKRWWIITMQILIAAALAGIAFTIPGPFWLQGSLAFFWLMAFSSATHDIAADGFYMLGLNQHQQAYFVGIRSTFYRIATIFSSGLLVGLAGALQVLTRSIQYSWSLVFYLVAGLFIALWLYHNWALPRPAEDGEKTQKTARDIIREFWLTLVTFFHKPQMWVGICFMLFYRMPEGLLSKVSALFLVDSTKNGGLGLSDGEFGLVQGTVGVIGLTLGGILGGICASRDGLKRWLWPMVMAITIPDIVYVYLSCALPTDLIVINICIFLEQFGYGFGFSAYMLYLIYYSQGEHKTAHYAICTAFMALSMMIPGLFAGALQESVGYQGFFLIVILSCLITYLVSSLLKIDPEFGKKKA